MKEKKEWVLMHFIKGAWIEFMDGYKTLELAKEAQERCYKDYDDLFPKLKKPEHRIIERTTTVTERVVE